MRELVEEAMRKAAVVWLDVAGRPPYPVWCLWTGAGDSDPGAGEALYVVSGPQEQAAPGLARAATAVVAARGDHGGRIVRFTARVERVRPGGAEWAAVVPQLAAKRLNAPPVPELLDRWARTATVSRLRPA
jgi:hypothetical protein